MGGVVIVAGVIAGYGAARLRPNALTTWSGLAVVFVAMLGAGAIGLIDDLLKVRNRRSLGLNKTAKMLGLLAVAVAFAVLLLAKADPSTTLSFTRYDNFGIELGQVGWVVLAVVMLIATTNAVNLTDGLDGLAGGSSAFVFSAFAIIGYFQLRYPEYYDVPHAFDLAVVAAASAGACAGFLWWNAAPAKIFMGDCGALALGAGIAGLALTTNTQLLLLILGGLFVAETMSVILQVISFRIFHRRIFRMSPIHHHFELKGWPETTVIIRFWIIAAMLAALGLALFYADYPGRPGNSSGDVAALQVQSEVTQ
jgi:phospho-N-acetylmuramoyl-pentapeptide-transferase